MRNLMLVLSLPLLSVLTITTSLFANEIEVQRVLNTGKINVSMTQDKDGLLWVGTGNGGVLCYDGYKIKKIQILENENQNKIISSIFVDKEGIIWFFAISEGLYSYNKNTGLYNLYKPEVGNKNSLTSDKSYWSPNLITEDIEGNLWVGTADGLNYYDKKTNKFTQYRHNAQDPNSLSNNSIWAVFVDRDDLIWIGTENGLNSYDKKTGKFTLYKHDANNPNSISSDFIYAITGDTEGNLWIGTKNTGMDRFSKQSHTFTHYKHDPNNPNSLSHNEIVHIMVDQYDNLWICNEGGTGVDRYDIKKNTFVHYVSSPKNPFSLSSNNIVSSFEDGSGIIWLVDCLEQINKCTYKKNIIKTYPSNKDFCETTTLTINGIYQDSDNNIWLGSYKDGLYLYSRDGKIQHFKPDANDPLSLPSNSVYSVLEVSKGKVWLGVYGGFISLFDVAKRQVIKNFKNPYATDTPRNLTRDNKNPNVLWFTSPFSGLFKLDTISSEFTQYKNIPNDQNSLSSNAVLSILQVDNTLWIGTEGGGLNSFDKTTGGFTCYKYDPKDKSSIRGNVVVQLFTDSRGSFWVTTDDGGLNQFDRQTEKFTRYGPECGFPSKFTRHILEDNEGYLWISTDSGIVKFDPIKLKVVKVLSKSDGLLDSQFHLWANALKDSNGNFWFSTLRGICKFNPAEVNKMEPNKHIPPVIITSFKSKEGTYDENGIRRWTEVKLPWPDNSFSFTFAALDYMDPSKNQYAYKLEGFDKNWNHIGTNHFGQYSNLHPGEYVLHLKGSNNDGIWNEEGISIKITITPPFWETSWFKWVLGVFILSFVGGLFLLVIRLLQKKAIHMRNQAIADITAQVAHDIRSPLTALNTALKSLTDLPEQERMLIRNATRRISDIANNLLLKYRTKWHEKGRKDLLQKDMKPDLVSGLLEYIILEKRVQFIDKSVEIILDLGKNTHSCFTNLEPQKFKRVISNLINNAAEAIVKTKKVIRIVLSKRYNDLVLEIIDNGEGIPENIVQEIKQGKRFSNKKGGCGLGISDAVQNIKNWGGNYDIQSRIGKGTTFIITLPMTKEPDWFQATLAISPNKHIIVFDDDESIHSVWQMRFREYINKKSVTLYHFSEPSTFIEYCNTVRPKSDLFLVDYEFINFNETGLDVINELGLKRQTILVTGRYEELEIREQAKKFGIKIIPKNFAPHIPISMLDNIIQENQSDLVLHDYNKVLTKT